MRLAEEVRAFPVVPHFDGPAGILRPYHVEEIPDNAAGWFSANLAGVVFVLCHFAFSKD